MNHSFGSGSPVSQPDLRILVVGTTPDYIEWIQHSCPRQALFFTDAKVRRAATEGSPEPSDELCCDLTDYRGALGLLEKHLRIHGLALEGIACFDCESMELTAVLAEHFSLPYPSVKAVRNCRDKLTAKHLWLKHGLSTAPAAIVGSADEAIDFFRTVGGPVVLKPTNGSGSELVFECTDAQACADRYDQIHKGLQERCKHRLYRSLIPAVGPLIMAEGFIEGHEYSCDFILQDGRARVIRLARKIKSPTEPFGTILGYLLPAQLPVWVSEKRFNRLLYQCAAALGLERAVCMLDFIISGDTIVLLELAPRPGGDCLPFLLRCGYGLDILKLQIDFSRQQIEPPPPLSSAKRLVGVRVLARRSGTLRSVDVDTVASDPRVMEIHVIQQPGHRITLPPADYESWLLGHMIFAPDDSADIHAQCNQLLDRIPVEVA
ncbi:MAG: ATP-grasp domain-containing protein [Deltaproteobacteria bacterium]|nr:ATP-grasp domain-containing protein [Deltaproteobacteria bacterium]